MMYNNISFVSVNSFIEESDMFGGVGGCCNIVPPEFHYLRTGLAQQSLAIITKLMLPYAGAYVTDNCSFLFSPKQLFTVMHQSYFYISIEYFSIIGQFVTICSAVVTYVKKGNL